MRKSGNCTSRYGRGLVQSLSWLVVSRSLSERAYDSDALLLSTFPTCDTCLPVGELSVVCYVLLKMTSAAEFAKAYSVRLRVFPVSQRGDMVAVGSR